MGQTKGKAVSRLPRPYIPISVRRQVAERQLVERGIWNQDHVAMMAASARPNGERLAFALDLMFGTQPVHLDHDPALVNRPRNKADTDYIPSANDPLFLVYRTKIDHDIKTRVHGTGAQHSDLGLARKNKRIAKNRDPKRRRAKIKSRGFEKGPKRKWPSRSFR